jgi:hypothetical protein
MACHASRPAAVPRSLEMLPLVGRVRSHAQDLLVDHVEALSGEPLEVTLRAQGRDEPRQGLDRDALPRRA